MHDERDPAENKKDGIWQVLVGLLMVAYAVFEYLSPPSDVGLIEDYWGHERQGLAILVAFGLFIAGAGIRALSKGRARQANLGQAIPARSTGPVTIQAASKLSTRMRADHLRPR